MRSDSEGIGLETHIPPHRALTLLPRSIAPLHLLPTLLLFAGCGSESSAPGGWWGTVDTLEGGGVVVRSPAEGIWGDRAPWRLEETFRVGAVEGTGPEVFEGISALEIDPRGRVYVLERTARTVKLFDSAGVHLRTFGREGGGPGELADPIGLALDPDGRLWVVDPGNGRYTVYDSTGGHVATHPRPVPGYSVPWPGRFARSGVLYDLSVQYGEDLDRERELLGLRLSDEGLAGTETVPVPPSPFSPEDRQFTFRIEGGMMAVSVPWAPNLVWWLDPEGFFWYGRSDRYRIVQRTLMGDTVKVVERDWDPVPVTEREVEEHPTLAGLREEGVTPDLSRIPDVKPAFRALRADGEGYLWVATHHPARSEGDASVDLFDPDGRYLGVLELPFDLRRAAIRHGRICGPEADELGVSRLVCLRSHRNGESGP